MAIRRHLALVLALCFAGSSGLALAEDDAMKKLEVFGDAPLEKGLWRMEIVESSNPALKEQSAKLGKAAICMDVAREISKGAGEEVDDDGCKQKIVSNTSTAGEIEVSCPEGDKTTVKITRAGPKSYLFDTTRTPTEGDPETMQGRYTYQGPCKGDSLVQMDRDSEACQKMRAQMAGENPAAMCAQLPEEHRPQCEAKLKSMTAMCE